MAAPVDADRATTDLSTSQTSQTVNLPGSIASGDVLVGIIRTATAATITWPAGWTQLEESTADGSDDTTSLAWRAADGTEGATISVTFGTAARGAALVYRITGTATLAVDKSSAATGSASHPDSPSYTVGKSHDTLWLSLAGGEWAKSLVSGPSGYSNATLQASSGSSSGGNCTVAGASKQANASTTENPGAWAWDSGTVWTAWTVAVYTASTDARISQEAVEVAVLPDSPKAAISQVAVEVAVTTSPPLRITQAPVEILVKEDNARVRVTQIPVEALLREDNAKVRVTQLPIEVLIEVVPVTASPFQAYIID